MHGFCYFFFTVLLFAASFGHGDHHCDHLPHFYNGRLEEGGNMEGDRRLIICDDGYVLRGKPEVVCTVKPSSIGRQCFWNVGGYCQRIGEEASLEVVRCGAIPTIEFGQIYAYNYDIGARGQISCWSGYEPRGRSEVICLPNGEWSIDGQCVPQITTQALQCGAVPIVENGRIRSGGYNIGDRRTVTCRPGNELRGNREITCQYNCVWSDPGQCVPLTTTTPLLQCGAVPYVLYGRVDSGGYNIGARRSITCRQGFRIRGNSHITCQYNCIWSDPGECEPLQCGAVPYVENGRIEDGNSTIGDRRRVDCLPGYDLFGSFEIRCQSDCTWSKPGTCILRLSTRPTTLPPPVRGCGSVPRIPNGFVQPGYSDVGNLRAISCQPGYEVRGNKEIICQKTYDWSAAGYCVPSSRPQTSLPPIVAQCGAVPLIDNGRVEDGGWSIGDRRSITCWAGYAALGDCEITCQSNGRWSQPGRCVYAPKPTTTTPRVTCGSVPFIENGRIQAGGFEVGDSRQILCELDFELLGNRRITCRPDGSWSSPGYCYIDLSCGVVPVVENGRVADGGSSVGDQRSITCWPGFNLVGRPEIICQENLTWSKCGFCVRTHDPPPPPRPPSVECGSLPYVQFGRFDAGGFQVGNRRILLCWAGYTVAGNTDIVCQVNGEWTSAGYCLENPPPQLTFPPPLYQSTPPQPRVECGDVPTIDFGRIESGGFLVGDRRRIVCLPGYTLYGHKETICMPDQTWSDCGFCSESTTTTVTTPTTTVARPGQPPSSQTCGPCTSIANGHANATGYQAGDECRIVCDVGYELGGNSNFFCRSDGTWSPAGYCIPPNQCNRCPPSPRVDCGYVEEGGCNIGDRRRVHCDRGYILRGTDQAVCQPDCNWNISTICEDPNSPGTQMQPSTTPGGIICPAPPQIAFGMLEGNGSNPGDRRRIVCLFGFNLRGNTDIYCQSDGSWSPAGRCELELVTITRRPRLPRPPPPPVVPLPPAPPGSCTCLPTPRVDCGRVADGGVNIGTRRRFVCDRGYVLQGAGECVCDQSCNWVISGQCQQLQTRPPPTTGNSCPPAPNIDHASLQGQGSQVGARRSITCDQGYQLRGRGEVVCEQGCTWSVSGFCERTSLPPPPPPPPPPSPYRPPLPPPVPRIVDCGPLPFVDCGRVEPGEFSVGSRRRIVCGVGYQLHGPDSIVCQANGGWSVPGYCTRLATPAPVRTFPPRVTNCGSVPFIAHGRIEAGGFSVGSRRRIICRPGNRLRAQYYITCQPNGMWSPTGYCERVVPLPPPPPPRRVECGNVPPVSNGRVEAGGCNVGDRRRLVCDSNYELRGSSQISCQSNGQWSSVGQCQPCPHPPPRPVAMCPRPRLVEHGYYEGTGLNVGDRRWIVCQSGYRLQGKSDIVCQANKQWSQGGCCELDIG